MALFTKLQFATIAILIVLLALSYGRYRSVSAAYELEKVASAQAIEAMNSAVQAYKRAEEQRELAFTVLSQTEDELASIRLENRDLEAQIMSVADDQDGDVAPILEAVRRQKFGGQR